MKRAVAICLSVLFGMMLDVAAVAAEESPSPRPLDEVVVDYEAGVLAFLKNTGRYGAMGTEFTVDDTAQSDNLFVASRLSAEVRRGNHRIVLLYAPLDVTTRTTLSRELRFRDETFAADSPVEHRYLFDGYRASYLYRLLAGQLTVALGGTLQIRNANVSFRSGDGTQYAQESDIGLVPALKLRARYQTDSGLFALLDADGLSTFGLVGDTEGGIYDVGLSAGAPISEMVELLLRVRGVGGGATVPDREIKNWAHFLSFTLAVRVSWPAAG